MTDEFIARRKALIGIVLDRSGNTTAAQRNAARRELRQPGGNPMADVQEAVAVARRAWIDQPTKTALEGHFLDSIEAIADLVEALYDALQGDDDEPEETLDGDQAATDRDTKVSGPGVKEGGRR